MGISFWWWMTCFDQASQYPSSLFFESLSWHLKPAVGRSFTKTWQWLWGSFYWSCCSFSAFSWNITSQLLKMATNFSSKASYSTSLGMPTMSRYYRLESCAFNQYWRSILTSLLDRRVLTCFHADTSASNLEKDLT